MAMRILVAGGGPGGLTTALALRRVGFEVVVLERSPELRTAGAGLTLQINAVRMLGALGLAEEVVAAGRAIRSGQIRRADGRVLADLDLEKAGEGLGVPGVGIHRAALSGLLARHLAPSELVFDAGVDAVEQDDRGVRVRTTGGRTFEGDVLVGADGLHSRVRAAVLGPRPTRYAGYTCWRGIAPVPAPEGGSAEIWGEGQRFGFVGTTAAETYWFATANAEPGGGEGEDHHAEVVRRFGTYASPVPDLVAATPIDAVIRNDIVDLAPMESWVRGRVALIGDAAHATTPNMGQGACMAIEDGVLLAAALAADPTPAGLLAWEGQRTARVQGVVSRSWSLGRIGQLDAAPLVWLRNTVVGLTPRAATVRSLRSLWDVPVPSLP
ncbi:MAG: FAD-dependent monooxygenase [Alphaproteobacteria bacterium]|nr:FAD-dependent monooxygenase [Alphaproteobacteria bacterium]